MGSAEKASDGLFDVAIIGAGISGINAAYRIQTELPSASYTIIEARSRIGGTWDLFRYPGFRSDSDLCTFGFAWRPWMEQKMIADGDSIRKYMHESAALYGIDQKIRFNCKLVTANWSSDQQAWSLVVNEEDRESRLHARFVILCTGYYDYNEALSSYIPGIERFAGTVVHPQFWPEDLNYQDKKIIIVGSGSTAVTLLPSLAETARHVTMLQRSPTYIIARPAVDAFGQWALKYFPHSLAHRITRLKYLVHGYLFGKYCSMYPLAARDRLRKITLAELPKSTPHDPHFTPRYNPWEQRLCLCPDGDFFKALRAGTASVVTDTIATVTETGIRLASGQTLDTDIIVTATGLKLRIAGGAHVSVDNVPITIGDKYLWKTAMIQDVPNLVNMIGYTNASWTLGADATALLVCRLLKSMKSKGMTSAVPRLDEDTKGVMKSLPALNLSSTYIARGAKDLPKTGDRAPWLPRSTYFSDLWSAKFGSITEGLQFEKVVST